MTNAHMDTGETFLFDVYEVLEALRLVVEEAAETVWANHREKILRCILDHLFYGSRLSGERELEKILLSYGIDEFLAIKGSRNLFSETMSLLHMTDDSTLGAGMYGYTLDMEHFLLLVKRYEYVRPRTVPPQDMDGILNDIERAIESGDYVPERLRRLVNLERQ